MEGSGKMIATAVGVHSQAGIIFALLGAAEIEMEKEVARTVSGHTTSNRPSDGTYKSLVDHVTANFCCRKKTWPEQGFKSFSII